MLHSLNFSFQEGIMAIIELSSKEDLQELAGRLRDIAEKKPFSEMEQPKISGKPGELSVKWNPEMPKTNR